MKMKRTLLLTNYSHTLWWFDTSFPPLTFSQASITPPFYPLHYSFDITPPGCDVLWGSRVWRHRQERPWQRSWRCEFTVRARWSAEMNSRQKFHFFLLLRRPTRSLRLSPEPGWRWKELFLLFSGYLVPFLSEECKGSGCIHERRRKRRDVGIKAEEERGFEMRGWWKRRSRGRSVAPEHPSSSWSLWDEGPTAAVIPQQETAHAERKTREASSG